MGVVALLGVTVRVEELLGSSPTYRRSQLPDTKRLDDLREGRKRIVHVDYWTKDSKVSRWIFPARSPSPVVVIDITAGSRPQANRSAVRLSNWLRERNQSPCFWITK